MSKSLLAGGRFVMHRVRRAACVAATLLAAAGCGSSPAAPSSAALHSELSDAAGDALRDASVLVSPDLVQATVDVSAGTITFTIRFAPGTLDRSTSRVTIDLDIDQNPSTGIRSVDGLGTEFAVDMWAPTTQASILKAVPTAACTTADPCFIQTDTAPLTVLADSLIAPVPLSLLGNASGRLNFRIHAYASKPGSTAPIVIADVMPDVALSPGHVP